MIGTKKGGRSDEPSKRAIHSPLDEPDVQVSRIRLSRKHTAAGIRRRLRARERQQPQSQASELLVEAHTLRRSERPLAAAGTS